MFKKLISTILSVSIILSACNLPTFAWAPMNYKDPKCIDLSDLGKETDYISLPLDGKKKKVCGCKKCTVDAVMYNRLEDYLKDLEKRFDSIAPKENYLENNIQLTNIYLALEQLSHSIENQRYKYNRNFVLVSTCYDHNDPTSIAQFAGKDGITYDSNKYDKSYFDNISNNSIKPLINKIEKVLAEKEKLPIAYNSKEVNKEFLSILIPALIITESAYLCVETLISRSRAKKHAAKLKQLISLVPKMTKAQKNTCLEKMNEYLEDSAELTEENLEKLPTKAIDELLKDIEK